MIEGQIIRRKAGRPKHTRQATIKQITALKLINEIDPETGRPYSKKKAMLRAGYSERVSNNPKRLMESQAIKSISEQFYLELKDVGITTKKLASKYAEWLDAEDPIITMSGPLIDKDTKQPIMKPDRKTQIAAGQMLKDIYNLTPNKKNEEGMTRRITLEEFLGAPQPAAGEVIEQNP